MSDKYFLDTNVVVYSVDLTSPLKRRRARELVTDGTTNKLGVISYQVVQEFVNVAIRKFQSAVAPTDLEEFLRGVLFPMMAVPSSPWLFLDALRLHDRSQLSWYDALVVAAAIQGRCRILYSEDLQHGRSFGDLVIQNPFL
ncbi:MAG TPA: PIN domain-containing protein [Terriglobales bacterium]|jgi:predicted nucleic acid-binding protein|nr:PIN domain-containing protein [Terriglobales bacterium]